MSMLKEFKEFAIKGNAVDLAIGVVIGASFSAIVNSLVDSIIMPVVGILTGGVNFKNQFLVLKPPSDGQTYTALEDLQKAGGVALAYGNVISAIVVFLAVAFVLFLVVKGMNKMKKKEAEAPAAPPKSEVLLEEIRDALRARQA